MTESEQVIAFTNDLDNLIKRYRNEFEMTAASFVGSLEFAKFGIMHELHQTFPDSSDLDDIPY